MNPYPNAPASPTVPGQDGPPPPPDPPGRPLRIALVAEDPSVHTVARMTFASSAALWRLEPHLQPQAAVDRILQHPPDIVLVDIGRPQRSAQAWVRHLKTSLPLLPVLMLVVSSDPDELLLALATGATGLLLWPASAPDLLDAVREVVAGGWYFCRKAQAQIGPLLARLALGVVAGKVLPPREQEVLVQVLQWRTDKEIARRLGIAEETVHWHLARLFREFEVHRREDLIRTVLRRR